MAANSKIEWTDATVNFWWGCTKVGPGCDHCYAERLDRRVGGAHWGAGVERRKIKGALELLQRLNRDSVKFADEHDGRARRIFIQSMSDLFDLEVPLDWFATAWNEIEAADCTAVQIVTKRISAVERRLAAISGATWPRHAGLLITVVNQNEADRDVPRLLALKSRLNIPWVGVSCEPLLGPIDLTRIEVIPSRPKRSGVHVNALTGKCRDSGLRYHFGWDGNSFPPQRDAAKLDWIIAGGESGPGSRPAHPDWVRELRDQCQAAAAPFFFKQWGGWAPDLDGDRCINLTGANMANLEPSGRNGDGTVRIRRLGKDRSGRLLDGREWNEFPEVLP